MPVLDRQGAPAGLRPASVDIAGPAPGAIAGPAPGATGRPAPGATARPAPGATGRAAPSLPPSLQGLAPRSVPEASPTPLQPHYINLSVIVLICGAIAITALELGTPLSSPLVKLCVLVASPFLVVTTADAVLRIWRSAWAWMPVNRARGTFRLAWVAVSLVGLGALVVAAIVVLLA